MGRAATIGRLRAALLAQGRARAAWRGAQAVVVACGHGVLRLGDDNYVVALGCSVAGERGWHGGRNGRRGAAKLSSVLLQNEGKGRGVRPGSAHVEEGEDRGSGPGVPTWRRGKTRGSGHERRAVGRPLRPAR
jgi:hypothetical protein